MFLVGMLSWWYGDGWRQRFAIMIRRSSHIIDFFSLSLLLSTLFAPFRQISAEEVNGSIGAKMRGFVDQLISRFIGLFVRIFTLIFGIITLIIVGIWSIVVAIVWLIIPLLPILGLVVMSLGWIPSWQ
jgi:hypothetical protein